MNLIKKYWLVIVLVFLVVVLIFLKIKYSNTSSSETENIQTNQINETQEIDGSEQINTTPTEAEMINTNEGESTDLNGDNSDDLSDEVDLETLEPFFPYQGKTFKVERYLTPGYLEVIINNENDLPKAKEEIEIWLKDHNTNSQETQLVYVFK